MRQTHRAGETISSTNANAGQTVRVVDRATDEARQAQMFVAVLGVSSRSEMD